MEISKTTRTSITAATAAAILFLLLLISGCGRPHDRSGESRLVIDELGRPVAVPDKIERIVSLAPSITEALFVVGAGPRVVGVTTHCDYPAEAIGIEKVGDTLRPSIEKIVALNPDLVIASTSSQLEQAVRKLDEIGLAVYVSNPRNLPGVVESIESLGRVLGDPDTAREVVMNMNQRIDAVRRNVDGRGRPRVLLVLGGQPLITVGAGSFITDLISLAGGESISANESFEYPQYSLETALARRPEIIFLQSGDEPLPERLKQTPAYQSGRIYRLDDALLLRPGPRLVEGLEQLAGKIHPEAFAAARVAEQ